MSWVEQTAEDGKGSADVDVAAEPEVAETLLEETIEEAVNVRQENGLLEGSPSPSARGGSPQVEVACDTVDVVELDEV